MTAALYAAMAVGFMFVGFCLGNKEAVARSAEIARLKEELIAAHDDADEAEGQAVEAIAQLAKARRDAKAVSMIVERLEERERHYVEVARGAPVLAYTGKSHYETMAAEFKKLVAEFQSETEEA